jgi:MoxR-like ATPase
MSSEQDVVAVDRLVGQFAQLKQEISKVIVGQDEVVENLILSIFCRSHSILTGVPGLAKTLLVSTLSEALGLKFQRIQFTPDLMPSDILGSEILDENRKFTFIKGPIFSNIVLADEINRTPPKTQAALLEAMQERNVTIAGNTFPMMDPFFVLATQNPIEQEGTYPLPEAQLDRFMFFIKVAYPAFEEEIEIVRKTTAPSNVTLSPVLSADEIKDIQQLVRKIPVVDNVVRYAVTLVAKTRPDSEYATDATKEFISWGAGPRASQNLILAAKAHAAIRGKYTPDQEDVRAVALPILRHRIVKNYKAEAEGITEDELVKKLL